MIPRLCYITDGERGTGGRPLRDVLVRLARGGVRLVILREPDAKAAEVADWVEALAPFRASGLRVLASRRLDWARALGMDAIPVAEARAWLGPEALIGYSAHSAGEARRVEQSGASYVTLSPIYSTGSKPGAPGRGESWLAEATSELGIPALALGGLRPCRVPGPLSMRRQSVRRLSRSLPVAC